MSEHIGNRIFLSEIMTIALLTIFGCLFSFLYEIGYFIVFGIPISLLGINMHNISIPIFILATYSVVIFALSIMYVIFKYLSFEKKLLLLNSILMFLIAFDLLMITIYLLCKIWNLFIILIVLLLGAIFSKYILHFLVCQSQYQYRYKKETARDFERPIYTEYKVKINSHTEKNVVQEDVNIDVQPDRKKLETDVWAGMKANIIIIAVLIMLSIISSAIGIVHAVTEEEYYVVNTSPEMVVLRIYGENIICAPFNRMTKKIYKNFVVKNINDFRLVMTLEKIGPLSSID